LRSMDRTSEAIGMSDQTTGIDARAGSRGAA
jgi:hypothetical protein